MHASPSVAVVLAVKRLDAAKSRLAAVASDRRRRELVAAMLADTLGAVTDAGVAAVVVVTPDPRVRELSESLGARSIAEPPVGLLSPLNAALAHGLASAAPDAPLTAVLQADLPALDGETLADALREASATVRAGAPAAFVADRDGSGTALLLVPAGSGFVPRFGVGSAAAHRAAGAVELDPDHRSWPRLRADVDTPADLAAAAALGLGPRTRDALECDDPSAWSDTDEVFLRG